jgi:hypothetical protein
MPTGIYQRKPHSEETKRKIGLANSFALRGRKLSEEHRRKVVLAATGRKHPPRSEKWIEKQRLSKAGKKTRPCSEITKQKICEAVLRNGITPPIRRGSESHFWKGGITSLNESIRKSLEYRKWRESVFERDNYQCVLGGKEHGSELRADHIKPFALYPDLRFVLENGRTLCESCHRKTDTYGFKTNSKIIEKVV